jgi:transcriptional/translational regulatory protein YebC/TACO1
LALDKANAANMPKDNIKRAIEKGSGTGETLELLEEIVSWRDMGQVELLF